MNHSRYLSDTRRSPYPRRRRPPVPRSPGLSRSLPAITLLSPDGYHLQQTMAPRPLSPGAFRMIPPSSAKDKMTSFVILNETITSPVASRAPSPSGRVSPFRGHGFKSPTSSRTNSRAVSPIPSPRKRKSAVVPLEKIKMVHMDIGLPPKSPKKVLKTVQIKEFKPPIKPKPILIKKDQKPVIPKVKIVNNKKPVVMSTVDKNKDKKSPAPPKNQIKKVADSKGDTKVVASEENVKKDMKEDVTGLKSEVKDDPVVVSQKAAVVKESTQDIKEKKENNEKIIPCYQPDKCYMVPPTMASPTQTTTAVQSTSTTTSTSRVAPSSLSAISSALSVTGTLSKKTLQPKPVERPITPKSPFVNEKIKSDSIPQQTPKIESAVATMTTVDEILKSRIGSAASVRSRTNLSLASPTPSEKTRSSMVTVRAASNGSLRSNGIAAAVISSGLVVEDITGTSDVISTTKLIRADSDVEVLSPNNLIRSPPHNMREPLWQEDRVLNGISPNTADVPKTRCGRFWASVWRFITYIFCCCKRWSCCRSACCQRLNCNCKTCCRKKPAKTETPKKSCCNPCSFFKTCFSKLNCCKKVNCCSCCKNCKNPCSSCACSKCCTKVKCCEGRKCCKKNTENSSASKMCCAKPCCSCKDCCTSVKNCCKSCNERVNSCCRSLFCLNFACCQRCLRRCSCCHKYKCCKKGGCCSCCNPNVKREHKAKLDKKTSRASNQSKQERAKLDSALVDHTSMMKAAVPVLPICLAWLCLFFNVFIPGSGTLFSGILCLCFGKPRFSVNDTAQNRVSAFLVNFVIALGQAFTILFCLVGWGWSIWWGVIMVKLARKQKRLKLAERNQEISPSTVNQNHVDAERR